MMHDVIEIKDLCKEYYPNLSNVQKIRRLLGFKVNVSDKNRVVLKNINLSIKKGEAWAVIGVNGAGKSTLLKIISKTIEKTSGYINVEGKVSALLELGLGFHGDLTGRENIYLSAQLHGHDYKLIKENEKSIIEFSELEEYIDFPVKTYSTGMHVRLAFAIATFNQPDVLIVDEALAVGDAGFQRKCFRRIEDFRSGGTTLLFVSHDVEAVKRFCDYGILLKDGEIYSKGNASDVCDIYEKLIYGENEDWVQCNVKNEDFSKNKIMSRCLEYGSMTAVIKDETIIVNEDFIIIEYVIKAKTDHSNLIASFLIKTLDGISIYGVDSYQIDGGTFELFENKSTTIRFTMNNNLMPGRYSLNVGLKNKTGEPPFIHRKIDSIIFEISTGGGGKKGQGFVNLNSKKEMVDFNV